MLTTLRIKNLALVDDLIFEPAAGYNVITGETGAGKSILIGALELVLGERADRALLRSGAESCTVEAVFEVQGLLHGCRRQSPELDAPRGGSRHIPATASDLAIFLEENGLEPCDDHQLVLKRTFTAAGANRQFVNGSPTTLAALKQVGEWLVDIHGPHDHQSLLHPARQLEMLDAFGGLEKGRSEFAELVGRRAALEAEKAALIVDEQTYARQLDLLRFQVREISGANLQADEEAELAQSHSRASNAARLLQLSRTALDVLSESEMSLLTQAGAVGRALQELQRADAAAAPLAKVHDQAVATLNELQNALSHYAEKVDLDPARLRELEERLNLVQSLKRKYGASLADVIAYGDEAARQLQGLEQRDAELARLNVKLNQVEAELWRAGQQLSAQRRKVIPQLNKAVNRQLTDLGFKRSRFDVAVTSESRTATPEPQLRPSGLDTIEFQFAPNPGEPAKPLRAIASSGELARVMLALKTVLAAEDNVPVLIFDEVDANVGGETANAVGEKMQQLAARRQVLCITHLPQVAAPAHAHYLVTKQVSEGRTVSEVEPLDRKERITELARMLGGQTDAARRHAEALVKQAAP